jgi:hypothetical protein
MSWRLAAPSERNLSVITTLWRRGLLVQKSRQQALGRLGVTSRLDDLIEHISVLINRSPHF